MPGLQFLDARTYNQLFTMHGTTMIFLFVMPMLTGLANYIVPLQIGAADMAFPRINALSLLDAAARRAADLLRLRRSVARPRRAGRGTRRFSTHVGRGRASTCG